MSKIGQKESTISELPRIYSEPDLIEFDKKVQRFYFEKPINADLPDGEKARIFNYDEFGVAYGALTRVKGAFGATQYVIPGEEGDIRYKKMWNLINQWQTWRRSKDNKSEFARTKQAEGYEMMAGQIPETEVIGDLPDLENPIDKLF